MPDIDDATRDALLLAADSPDAAAQARLDRRKRFILGRRIVLLAVGFIAGAGIAIAFAGRVSRTSGDIPSWQHSLGICLIVGGILLEITYFVVIIRNGEFSAGWRSPSLVLGWRQRRAIRQQIRGRLEVDPAMLPISRELAARTKSSARILVMMLALAMIAAGQTLNSTSSVQLIIAVGLGVLYLCLAPFIIWESRRAARFLERNPAPLVEE